jgi:hypothetical protein
MSNFLSKQYELLAGPYRTAIWAILCRFKTRFVGNLANDFCALPGPRLRKKRTIEQALYAYSQAYKQFLDSKEDFRRTLTAGIEGLKANLDSASAAEIRTREIEQYLGRTLEKWQALAERWGSLAKKPRMNISRTDRDQIFEVIGETLWPYYGVIYKARERSYEAWSQHNVAVWVPTADLLSQPFLVGTGHSRGSSSEQILYPTLQLHPEPDSAIRTILKIASDTFQDFDDPPLDDPVGLVQMLPSEFLGAGFGRYAWIAIHLHEYRLRQRFDSNAMLSAGRFQDLFFFNNDVVRSVVQMRSLTGLDTATSENDDSDAKGILYLAGPSMDAVGQFIDTVDQRCDDITTSQMNSLRRRMHKAWLEAGGSVFSLDFQENVANLRRKLLDDVYTSELSSMRADQGAAWAHDVKNWTGPIIRDLGHASACLRDLQLAEKPAAALRRAELNSRLLNIVAIGRQYVFEDLAQHARERSSSTVFLNGKDHIDARFFIESAFQLLLTLHSGTHYKEFALSWFPQWKESEVLEQMERSLEDKATRRIYSATVAFLREVVHNMRVDESKKVPGRDVISVWYEFEQSMTNLVLHVHQKHVQMERRWGRMPPGLQRANMLYGPKGARLGHIPESRIELRNEEIKVTQPNGQMRSGQRIFYDLAVEFFV